MCRWLAYSGAPLYLEELLFKPSHSLIDQSLHAHYAEETTNGDGFGVGWYGSRGTPGVYRSIRPAWNDRNLIDLAAQIDSTMFVAHVRATTGSEVEETNCHPFRHGRWLFVHNGEIRSFKKIRRELMLQVHPDLFNAIEGTTDSEVMFYLALSFGLEEEPIPALERMTGEVERVARAHDIEQPVQMTLGLTDGTRIYAVRYSSEGESRTLFCSEHMEALKSLYPELEPFSSDARAVVSEPIGGMVDNWMEIPESSVTVVEGGHLESMPFNPS
jgi:glutamine amidotransferase